jgi:hypothetical protein
MDGGGLYAILSGVRYVYGVYASFTPVVGQSYDTMTSTRLSSTHYNFYIDSFEDPGYGDSQLDLVPLDVNATVAGGTLFAGDTLESMDYVVGNSSDYDPPLATYVVDVYLSSNNNISTSDTLLQTHTFDYDFGPRESTVVSVAVPPTIPTSYAAGSCWIGIIVQSADSNSADNDTDGWDAQELLVEACDVSFSVFGTPTAGAGGVTPVLFGTGSDCGAGGHEVRLAGGLGGALGILWIGVGQVDWPLFGGNFYIDLTQPNFRLTLPLFGPSGVPGAGYFDLPGSDITDYLGIDLYFQWMIQDAAGPKGWSLSNGLILGVD